MVMFWAIQQELDCINRSGSILGKIQFNTAKDSYVFNPADDSVVLSADEKTSIDERLLGLNSGQYAITMQDDD